MMTTMTATKPRTTTTERLRSLPPRDEMYRAVVSRDSAYDGVFIIAVRTTGIFCRPTCPARKPNAGNVEYFAAARDALHAGYRPCKRCRPMDVHGSPPQWIRQLTSVVDRDPGSRLTDVDLRAMGIDPARARRYFQANYGMTFHAYHRARRLGLALASIRAGESLDRAALRHGFESTSGFRDAFVRLFGRPAGDGMNVRCLFARWLDTPLGAMIAVADDEGLHLLEWIDRRAFERQVATLRRRTSAVVVPGDHPHLDSIATELEHYFSGDRRAFDTPVVLNGTRFQCTIWRELLEIPLGKTCSYGCLARDLGRPGAQRAIGRANGDNRLAIIVPCHRVVRDDGTLCGYGGGLWRKQWLLDHERRMAAADSARADSLFDASVQDGSSVATSAARHT
jgi:AraC family transcriptional regulator of adaptative response/methylated-DNA-[protein]-cysteine methyltransferase